MRQSGDSDDRHPTHFLLADRHQTHFLLAGRRRFHVFLVTTKTLKCVLCLCPFDRNPRANKRPERDSISSLQLSSRNRAHLGQVHGRKDGVGAAVESADESADDERNDGAGGFGEAHEDGGEDGDGVIGQHRPPPAEPVGEEAGGETADEAADGPDRNHEGEEERDYEYSEE